MRSVTVFLLAVLCIVLVAGGVLLYQRDGGTSLWDTMRSVKETSQDAATTSKVKTALLLSKHVSAFNVKVTTNGGTVTLSGEVPSEATRRLAVTIAQDTSGVARVQDNLTLNPGVGRNQDTENLADRVADLEIKTIVIDQLAQSPDLKDKRFTVQVTKRTVTLDGAVDSPAQKRVAENLFPKTYDELTNELLDYLYHRGRYADAAGSPSPGLILLDLNMPRKDGREALREIKADPDLRRVASLATVGFLIAGAALRREETRGGHFRADFPIRDDIHFGKHFADVLRT